MGKGPGPTALEQLFVANSFETLVAPLKSTLTRFNIKTHEATTPIERTYLSSDTNFLRNVAVYKGKVYVANTGAAGDGGAAGSSVDVFNANTLELEKTWKTSQFGPIGVAAYKDNIYVTCIAVAEASFIGNAVDVFPVDAETGARPAKSWRTSQIVPYRVAAYKDNIYVTCLTSVADPAKSLDGNAVDVFPVDAETGARPTKSWVTSQFGPIGVAAYEENIYVTCLSKTGDNDNGSAVDVFPVDTGDTGGPGKSWVTSQFGPIGVAAYKDNIYVTCASKTEGTITDGNAVDVFPVNTGNKGLPDKSWVTSQIGPIDVAAYEENIYVTCYLTAEKGPANTIDIFPVAAETGAGPSEIWKTDYGPGGIAAYNSLHPEGNLYIDSSGSNVV